LKVFKTIKQIKYSITRKKIILLKNKMHYFTYDRTDYDVVDECLHGWCYIVQELLAYHLPDVEKYEIFDKTCDSKEYMNDHQIIKYKGYFIDVRGIFTEEEMLEEHIKEYKKVMTDIYSNPKFQPSTLEKKLQIDSYIQKISQEDQLLNLEYVKKEINLENLEENENDTIRQSVCKYVVRTILNDDVLKSL